MIASVTTAQSEFTIDGAQLRDQDFQLKLEKFIAEASDSKAHVAANGEWNLDAGNK
jgi:hypothetical protein